MFVANVHAQVPNFRHWITDREGPPHIGTQVKIERFTSADAKNIRAAGLSFVRFGVWVNSMPATAYQARVSRAFAVAHSAGLPVLVTLRSTVPLVQSSSNEANRRLQLRDAAKKGRRAPFAQIILSCPPPLKRGLPRQSTAAVTQLVKSLRLIISCACLGLMGMY